MNEMLLFAFNWVQVDWIMITQITFIFTFLANENSTVSSTAIHQIFRKIEINYGLLIDRVCHLPLDWQHTSPHRLSVFQE